MTRPVPVAPPSAGLGQRLRRHHPRGRRPARQPLPGRAHLGAPHCAPTGHRPRRRTQPGCPGRSGRWGRQGRRSRPSRQGRRPHQGRQGRRPHQGRRPRQGRQGRRPHPGRQGRSGRRARPGHSRRRRRRVRRGRRARSGPAARRAAAGPTRVRSLSTAEMRATDRALQRGPGLARARGWPPRPLPAPAWRRVPATAPRMPQGRTTTRWARPASRHRHRPSAPGGSEPLKGRLQGFARRPCCQGLLELGTPVLGLGTSSATIGARRRLQGPPEDPLRSASPQS